MEQEGQKPATRFIESHGLESPSLRVSEHKGSLCSNKADLIDCRLWTGIRASGPTFLISGVSVCINGANEA